jgi:hypothetical protein
MPEATPFVAGLELAEAFYHEVIRGILTAEQPDLVHSAGLIGYGSDVLGLDSERSRDHNWGPRGYLFLSRDDYALRADELRRSLRAQLPATFRGYSVHFSEPDPRDNDTRQMEPGTVGEIDSLIVVSSLEGLLAQTLGGRRSAHPNLFDWLSFPEQALLELTAGRIFHDGLGTLAAMRARFAYFPRDVWLHRLSCQWQRIAQEEGFVGRCAEAGDDLGSRLVAARLVRDMIRLAFLMERRYAPYSKWLGTAFAKLACAKRLQPALARALDAGDYGAREAALCDAAVTLAKMHNALAITESIETTTRPFFERPYQVIFANRFDAAIREQIQNDELRALPSRLPAVDQLTDLAGATRSPILTGRMRAIYFSRGASGDGS